MSIVLDQITKRFDRHAIVNQVSLEIADGEMLVLLGPSGSGKSTLLKAMALLEQPDGGTISIDGAQYVFPGNELPAPWPKVNIVFQQLFLWPHLTLRQNMELPHKERMTTALKSELDELVSRFSLRPFIDKYPNETSVGQRQRAALIRALGTHPKYLLLDEVTSALDIEHGYIVGQGVKLARPLREGVGCHEPAHRGADPQAALDLQAVEQPDGQAFIEGEAVLLVGHRTPLAQAAADRVGADDAVALRQVAGDVVHVATGARQPVPGDDHLSVLAAPFGVVQLAAGDDRVVRGEVAHGVVARPAEVEVAPARNRPTMPLGKW